MFVVSGKKACPDFRGVLKEMVGAIKLAAGAHFLLQTCHSYICGHLKDLFQATRLATRLAVRLAVWLVCLLSGLLSGLLSSLPGLSCLACMACLVWPVTCLGLKSSRLFDLSGCLSSLGWLAELLFSNLARKHAFRETGTV